MKLTVRNPLVFAKNAINKLIIGPLKYGKGDDYNASGYWHDRFSRYGTSTKGVGVEGLSEKKNQEMYQEAATVVKSICQQQNINSSSARVLDIGCGNGFYTNLMSDLGVKDYTGLDITDVLFPDLSKNYPQYKFIKRDISFDKMEGNFDIILFIDVIEHIVKDSKLTMAMNNVKDCLTDDGVVLLAPIMKEGKRHLFYVRFWSLEEIKSRFPGYDFTGPSLFRGSGIVAIKKPR